MLFIWRIQMAKRKRPTTLAGRRKARKFYYGTMKRKGKKVRVRFTILRGKQR